jgi:hypothetical protein
MVTQRDAVAGDHHADHHLTPVATVVTTITVAADILIKQRSVSFEVGGGDVIEDQVHRLPISQKRLRE